MSLSLFVSNVGEKMSIEDYLSILSMGTIAGLGVALLLIAIVFAVGGFIDKEKHMGVSNSLTLPVIIMNVGQ